MFDHPKMLSLPNGIRLAAYEAGNSGPPVVFCHGFPELAYTWRHVMPAVAAAGYRTAAIDMRGFGRSDRPEAVEAYDILRLTQDLAQAAAALGFERPVFIGHDWGASVVWEMPLLQPAATAGLICVNTPRWKYRQWGDKPTEYLRDTYGADHYMLAYQIPGLIDAAMVPDDDYEGFAIRRHRKPPFEIFPVDPGSDYANQRLAGIRNAPLGERCLTDEEAAVYGREYRRTGFTGGLNLYRNIDRNAEILKSTSTAIGLPALMIAATHDIYNPPEMSVGTEELGPAVERIILPRSGHWLPDENREDLNQAIVGWLDRYRSRIWG